MSFHPSPDPPKAKKRVLIVEDEAMIAFMVEESLNEGGFEVAGVAGRLETALTFIELGQFDAAVLDSNLAGVSAGPAAAALRALGRPFVVVSGYLPSQQQEVFVGAPCIQKPYDPQSLIDLLRDILDWPRLD